MNKTGKLLAAVAVVQMLLIAITWMDSGVLEEQADGDTLLVFNVDEIDGLVISDNDHEVVLQKKDGVWQNAADEFPADGAKINGLLAKLHGLQYGLPVATSKQALQRFKISGDIFERRIRLQKAGQTIAELYLGTGAGARQSHVRNAEQKAVYTAAIGSYDVSADSGKWQDTSILELDETAITAIVLDDLELQRNRDSGSPEKSPLWAAVALPDKQQLNQEAVNEAVHQLASLRFMKVLGRQNKPEYNLDHAVIKVRVHTQKDKRDYRLARLKNSAEYVLKVSDREEYFQIAASVATPLAEQWSRGALLDKVE